MLHCYNKLSKCYILLSLIQLLNLADKFLNLFQMFLVAPAFSFLYFLAVGRRRHMLHLPECLCKNQRVLITAGNGNAFYRKGSQLQQFRRFGYAKCHKKLLRRHSQRILKQRIKVASINTDVIRHIRHPYGIAIIPLDKFHRFADISIGP